MLAARGALSFRAHARQLSTKAVTGAVRSRQEIMSSLASNEKYDILVVGGGATGAGVALDAATRGLKVACVERGDFASETSSRSTKLIWAGSRYLFNVVAALTSSKMLTEPMSTLKRCYEEYKMVVGCATERRYMAEKNPHLVNWIPIAMPFETWTIWPPPMGAWAFTFMPIACRFNAIKWFYDSLAGFSCPPAFVMSRDQAHRKFPQLRSKDIKFCAVLHEAQHNDARTNLAIALTASQQGADITNYAEVVEFSKNEEGKLNGATIMDHITGEQFKLSADTIVMAGGPYTDSIRAMETEAEAEAEPAVQGGPGIHIVLPGYMCPSDMGLLDYNTSDGRFLFFLPWKGSTLVGTTDKKSAAQTAHDPPEDEVQWVLNECAKYLDKDINVRRSDVLSAWRGWRPLAKDPHAAPGAPVSRDHIISQNLETGSWFMAGGKWTTWREMAEDLVDKVVASKGLSVPNCTTHTFGLFGADGYSAVLNCQLVQQYGVSAEVAQHLATTYGGHAHEVCKYLHTTGKRWPLSGIPLQSGYPYLEAEVRYAVHNEWAQTVKDVVTLRTRLAYLNQEAARAAVPRVAEIMAEELKWGPEQIEAQTDEAFAFLDTFGGEVADKSGALLRAATAGDVESIFNAIDTDNSGSLDRKEVEDAAIQLGFPLDDDGLDRAFAAMDADGNGNISLEEFTEWWNSDHHDPMKAVLHKEMTLSLEKARDGGGGVMFG